MAGEAKSKLNAEYHAVDLYEDVVYRRVRPEGERTPAVRQAVKVELVRREAAAAGGYFTVQETVWELPLAPFQDVEPEEGDVIERSNGERWRVLEVRRLAFDTVYQLPVARER